MSDLVERLNKVDDWPREICHEAANRIEALEAELKKVETEQHRTAYDLAKDRLGR